jgi:hypothetical protein
MFMAAAARYDPSFVVGADTAPAVAMLCARLDGLPLALELAAARVPVFGIEELAARLTSELGALGIGPRDAPARQRTLNDTIDWSYRLLDEPLKLAFARFGVFAGGATIRAVEDVIGADVETIEALVSKNLLVSRRAAAGSSRLAMLKTLREFALARLAEDPGHESIRHRHLAHYLTIVERVAPQLWTPQENEALAVLDREIDNLRAALLWALKRAPDLALRLAGPLGDYGRIHQDPDALGWVDAALAAADDETALEALAYLHLMRSYLLGQRDDPAAAADAANAALESYRELDDDWGIASSFNALASSAMHLDDVTRERSYAEAACQHARACGDESTLGIALAYLARTLPADERLPVLEQARVLLGGVGNYRQIAHAYGSAAYAALEEGRPAEALALLEVAVPAGETLRDPGTRGVNFGNLGLAHLFLGEVCRARDEFIEEVVLCSQQALRYGVEEGLAGLDAIAAHDRADERAARLIGAAHALGKRGLGQDQILARLERDYFAAARARIGEHDWRHAEQDGEAMSNDEAITYALCQPRPEGRQPASSAAGSPELHRR